MITALRRRPLVRPLFIWMAGILLHLFFSFHLLVGFALLISLIVISLSHFSSRFVSYQGRWIWGSVFSSLLFALSVSVTEYAERRLSVPDRPARIEQVAATAQQRMVTSFDHLRLSDKGKSVLATLTVGYRQAMDREMNRRFTLAGVSHILSVSGFHVAVVCGFITLLFGWIPKNRVGYWIKYPFMLLLLWGFVWITGLSAPSVRSGLMMSFFLIGQLVGQKGDGYNTLAASALLMLVYNPFYIYDIGFQLSYLAVWFILYLQPRLKKLIDVRNPILGEPCSWVATTLAAQAGTSFLCLYYFGQFSTVFLFTNLPLSAISTLLIPSGLLVALLPVGMPGYAYLQIAVEKLTQAMLWVVERFSAMPIASLTFKFDFVSLMASYLILLLFLAYGYKKRPPLLLAALFVCLFWLLFLVLRSWK